MAAWHTNDTARAEWRNAPSSQEMLASFLAASKHQCLVYLDLDGAPAPTDIPDTWRLAHLLQAIDLYTASQTGDKQENTSGYEGMQTRRPRMSATVRNLLIPYRGIPQVG